MVYSEVRVFDNIAITQKESRIVALPTGSKLISVVDVQAIDAGAALSVSCYYIDPGAKTKLGGGTAIIGHNALGATGADEKNVDEATGKRWTGLWRVDANPVGGNATITHTLVSKD